MRPAGSNPPMSMARLRQRCVAAAVVTSTGTIPCDRRRHRRTRWTINPGPLTKLAEKMYGLITGFLEKGETPDAAIRREVQEELAWTLSLPTSSATTPFEMNQLILAYHVPARGKITLGEELADIKRVPVERLKPWTLGTVQPSATGWRGAASHRNPWKVMLHPRLLANQTLNPDRLHSYARFPARPHSWGIGFAAVRPEYPVLVHALYLVLADQADRPPSGLARVPRPPADADCRGLDRLPITLSSI